jgi:hypothetical protein
MKMPGSLNSHLHVNTDSRKKLQINLALQHTLTFEGSGQNLNIQPEIIYKPLNALSLSLSPNYMLSYDELQYVDQQYFGSQPRYIYGTIDQKIVGMSFRVNFNLTPDLTFQYWGQPFVAYGSYNNFKYVTAPMASEYHDRFTGYSPDQIHDFGDGSYYIDENKDGSADYSFGKPDFNFREFLSNLVLRWEYNPGSSIYLVWSQTRSNSDYTGSMDYSNEMDCLFGTKPHNVFLIKFSYRFGLR